MLLALVLPSCQQDFNSSRENVQTELNTDDEGWKDAVEIISASKDQKIYFWDEEELLIWKGEKEADQLIAIKKEKSLIVVELWDKRNEEWQSEELVYKSAPIVKDYIALKKDGIYQIAMIHIGDEEIPEIKELTFLTSSPKNKSFPAFNEEKQKILYNVSSNDSFIGILDLKTGETKKLIDNASIPRWLNNDQLIYIDESQTQRQLYVSDLEGDKKLASDKQIKEVLELSKTYAGKAFYALKLSEIEIEEQVSYNSLKDLLRVVSRRSDAIKAAKHEALAVLAEYFQNRYNKGPDLVLGAAYTVDNNLATQEEEESAGDYSSLNDFMRITTGLNFTVIPNRKYRQSFNDYKHWKYEEAIQVFYQVANQELYKTLSNVHKVIHKRKKIQVLQTIIETCELSMEKYTKLDSLNLDSRTRVDFYEDQKAFYERQLVLEETERQAALEKISLSLNLSEDTTLNLALISRMLPPDNMDSLFSLLNRSQLNQPFQRQLYFRIMQAAAERDMGHPIYRRDYLNIQANYGFGVHHWDEVIDDFVSVSANTVMPLRSEELQLAYNRQWTNRIKSLRYEHELLKKTSEIKITELYNKIKGFRSYYTQFQKTLLNMYDKIRRQVAFNRLGNYSEKELEDLDEIHIQYLNGQLEKLDVYSEGLRNHLDLLRELGDFHLFSAWFSESSRETSRVFHAAKFSDVKNKLIGVKNYLKTIKDLKRLYLILDENSLKNDDLEVQYIYKKTLEKRGNFIPTFYNSEQLANDLKTLKEFQRNSRAYFPRVAIAIKNKDEIQKALDISTKNLGINQEIHLFLPDEIKQVYIPPETEQKINLYSVAYEEALQHKLISEFPVTKINVLYKKPTSEIKVEQNEAATVK